MTDTYAKIKIDVYYQPITGEFIEDSTGWLFNLSRNIPVQRDKKITDCGRCRLCADYYFDYGFCDELLKNIFTNHSSKHVAEHLNHSRPIYLHCIIDPSRNDQVDTTKLFLARRNSFNIKINHLLNFPVANSYEIGMAKSWTAQKEADEVVEVFRPETSLIVNYKMDNTENEKATKLNLLNQNINKIKEAIDKNADIPGFCDRISYFDEARKKELELFTELRNLTYEQYAVTHNSDNIKEPSPTFVNEALYIRGGWYYFDGRTILEKGTGNVIIEELHKFDSGMVRSKDADKARYDLIPRAGLEFMGRTMKMGAEKYGEYNWQRGGLLESTDALNHALQHIYKWLDGDRSENHLAHCACNLFFAMHYNQEELEKLNP